MNDTTANHHEVEVAADTGDNVSNSYISHRDSDSPQAQASIIGWSSQAALVPVENPHQGRAPSPMSVASTLIDMMQQQSIAFARYSEHHPRYPFPYSNEVEAPSASASASDQRSITPEVEQFQPPTPPYIDMPYGQHQHRPMPVHEQEPWTWTWSVHRPFSDYVYAYENEYSEDALRRTAPFPAQAQVPPFSHEYECGSCRDDEPLDFDLDLDCPFHDYSVKSLRAKELFIAHVPVDMSEEELKLKELCSQYGDVISASIMNHGMGVSRCYAYVKYDLQSAADDALLRLNHHEVSINI